MWRMTWQALSVRPEATVARGRAPFDQDRTAAAALAPPPPLLQPQFQPSVAGAAAGAGAGRWVGGLLRTSTLPTLNVLLLLRAYV